MRYRTAILVTLFIFAAGVHNLRATQVAKVVGPMRIEVVPANLTIVIGDTQPMQALLESFRGFQKPQNARLLTATWTSSNTAVATVDSSTGVVTAVGKGVTVISAQKGPFRGSTLLTVTPVLNSITVTPANQTIPQGTTLQFTATGNYADASTADLTTQVLWTSTDQTIATIVAGGLATASSNHTGGASIQATYNSVMGQTGLTVSPAELVSISVTPKNPAVPKGALRQFIATGSYTNGDLRDITNSVTWASSDMSKATIDNAGLASTLAEGQTTISATLSGKTDSTTLFIGPATVNQVQVSPHAAGTIPLGDTYSFTALAFFTDGSSLDVTSNGGTTWTSSNDAVATVSAGLVTSHSQGNNVQITASYGGFSDVGTISIAPPALKSIAVTPSPVTIPNGLTQQFTATGTYTDNSTQDLTNSASWSASSPTVASVTNTGLATCKLANNNTLIIATSNSINGSATLNCGPPDLSSITVTPANSTIPNGTTSAMVATGHYTDNTTQELTFLANWSSSNPAIASIVNTPSVAGNGKVTAKTQGGPVVITATFNSVSGTTNLTVGPPNLVSVAVTPVNPSVNKGNTQQFTATGTYTDNSTQNLTNTAAWSSSATGVATINASTGLATAVSIGTSTVTATQSSISGNTTMRVLGPPSRFAYTANFNDNTIEEFTVNANGQLRNNGYVFNGANTGPEGVTVDPSNSYVYVANNGLTSTMNTVSAYTINSTSGTLAPITGSPFTAGNGPTMLAFSVRGNGGRSAYVTNAVDSTISEFTVNGNGSLTLLTTTAPTVATPEAITVTPNGLYAYVANQGASPGTGNVAQYSIVQNTGALSALNTPTVAAPGLPQAIAVDPFSRFVFVADTRNPGGTVSAYKINNDGTLAFQNTLSAGNGTFALTTDPGGHFVYATNYVSNTVSAYTVDQTSGALTAVVGTPTVTVGSSPQAVSVDSSGQFLYVGHFGSHEVWEYSINGTTGALTFVRKMRSGKGVDGMAISSGNSAPVYTDFLAFDVNNGGVGEALADGSSGALSNFANATPAAPATVAVDPYERFVYSTNFNGNTIARYSIGAFGAMTFNGTTTTTNNPFFLAIDPSGRFLYVESNAGVFGFTINQSNGSLTAISGGAALGTGGNLQQIAIDPTGRFLFVGDANSGNTYAYSINPATGVLTNVTGSPFSTLVVDSLAVDPSGRFLYVAGIHQGVEKVGAYAISNGNPNGALTLASSQFPNFAPTGVTVDPYGRYVYACLTNNTVVAFTVDQNGSLLSAGSPVSTGNGPSSIAMDFQGQYVYVTNNSSNTISAYKIDQGTGALTEITGAGSPFAAGTSPGSVVISGVIQ